MTDNDPISRQRAYYESYNSARNEANAARYVEKRWRLLPAPSAGGRMLDLGCGEAILARRFAAHGCAVAGLDLAPRRLRSAAALVPGGLFAIGLAEELPFADGAFDVVFANALLHHAASWPSVLREAVRVTRSGGAVAVVEPSRRNPLIALQAASNPAERGLFRISFRRVVETLAAERRVAAVERGSFGELIYPYRRFPGPGLLPVVERAERWLHRGGFRTHRFAVARVR